MKDAQILRFFAKRPHLARTAAGQKAILAALLRRVGRLEAQVRSLQSARIVPEAGDWLTAVRIVQRWFPGSEAWILSCSQTGSEGGWGRWVPNTQGSGAGGWMQYMEGTFWTDFNAAVQDLTARRVKVPRSAWSWYSPLGQALAAGWAYHHARPAGKWTGWGC